MDSQQKLFEDPPASFPNGKSLEQRFMERNVARETARSADEVSFKMKRRKENGPRWRPLLGNEDEGDEKKEENGNEETDEDFEGDWDRDWGRLRSRSEIKSMEGTGSGWAPIHRRRQSEGDNVPERWKPSGKWNTRERSDNWRSGEKRESRWSPGQGGWQPSSPISPSNPGGRRYSWANREDRSPFLPQSKALQNDWRVREDKLESDYLDTKALRNGRRAREDKLESECLDTKALQNGRRAREDEVESECSDTQDGYCDLESTHYIRNTLPAMAHSYNRPRVPNFLSEILELVNDSPGGHALKAVVDTMFRIAPTTEDHVTGELSLPVYVELSQFLVKSISPNIADKSIKDSSGHVLSGSDLVRVYISWKCISLVKREWDLIRSSAPKMPLFLAELHRHDLCSEAIVISCVKELLGHGKPPEVDSVRTLCELLAISGEKLYKRDKTRIVVDEALNYIEKFGLEGTDNTVHLRLELLGTLGREESS